MTDMYQIWIPRDLPDLNDVLDKRAAHWSQYSTLKKQVHRDIAWFLQDLPKDLEAVQLTCLWVTANRRKDPDNLAFAQKFLIDSLVEQGIIANDGWKQIVPPLMHFWAVTEHKDNTGAWLWITPVESPTDDRVEARLDEINSLLKVTPTIVY